MVGAAKPLSGALLPDSKAPPPEDCLTSLSTMYLQERPRSKTIMLVAYCVDGLKRGPSARRRWNGTTPVRKPEAAAPSTPTRIPRRP